MCMLYILTIYTHTQTQRKIFDIQQETYNQKKTKNYIKKIHI